jgi:hypothetical protein
MESEQQSVVEESSNQTLTNFLKNGSLYKKYSHDVKYISLNSTTFI